MPGDPAFMRWTPAEWIKVAVHALPHLDKGQSLVDALREAQRTALQPSRHRDEDALRSLKRQAAVKRHLEKARALPTRIRDEIAKQGRRKSIDDGRNYSGRGKLINWTTLEKARIARQVDAWREAGDTRALSRLIIEAQELVIEPERRRPITSIQVAAVNGANSKNERMIAEGRANVWLLTDAPSPTPIADAPVKAAPAAQAEPIDEAPPTAESASTETSPRAQEAQRRPARAASTHAAQAFAETMMSALDSLLASHTDTVLREVHSKLDESIRTTGQQIAAQIAAQIEMGMRATVHRIVEAELGGPVSPPGAGDMPAAPASTSVDAGDTEHAQTPVDEHRHNGHGVLDAPAKRPLKVDVVGLVGNNITEVRSAFNGNTDLRFVDPDHLNAWAPHKGRHVVCAVKWIPHKARQKLRSVGMQMITVHGSVGTVIHAIEELHRSHGADMNR
jgi:hypothetical protein